MPACLLLLALHAAGSATPTPPPPPIRVSPDSQAVFVALDPGRPALSGSTTLWFTLADSARSLWLACDGLELGSLALAGPGGAVTTAWAAGPAGLVVDALRGLAPGRHRLEVSFQAPWRAEGGWRRGPARRVWLDSAQVAAAFPCAGDSVPTSWRLHVQTPRDLRARAALSLRRRERDREVEVTEWASEGALPPASLRLRASPPAPPTRRLRSR